MGGTAYGRHQKAAVGRTEVRASAVVFGLVLMVHVLGRINDLSDPYVTLLVDTSGDHIAAAAAARAVAKSTAAMQRQGM